MANVPSPLQRFALNQTNKNFQPASQCLRGSAFHITGTLQLARIYFRTRARRMVQMMNNIVEAQPINPLAADLAFLEMNALVGLRGFGLRTCIHAVKFCVSGQNRKRADA